jgi:V/A-type H+/Na+-transporting ATPase subunit D
MKRVRFSKDELRQRRDALRRFERYLPALQLKKQQLQMEVRRRSLAIEGKAREEREAREALGGWVELFAEPVALEQWLRIAYLERSAESIAGVSVPVLDRVSFDRSIPDLFHTSPWVDDGLDMLESLLRLRLERRALEEQHRLLAEELRVTTQRVNLFEKVKIPETREDIRILRIFLGDQQTAEVARAKMAKARAMKAEARIQAEAAR